MASAVVETYSSVQGRGKDGAGSLQDMQKGNRGGTEYMHGVRATHLAPQQQQQLQSQQPLQHQASRRHVSRGPYSSANQFTQKVELYRGSVSTVYQALDEAAGQRVILKCYHKGKMQDKHYHKLNREIQAMQAMRGPYVVDLYGWFQDDASVWLVMEWCEGGDLFKCMMLYGGRLDEFYVCTEVVAPLLRVLEKSHTQCFMHRDIKPENIFLTKGNRLRLGDFGLAVNWTLELPFSRSGTLDYMAPEVLRNPATTMQEGPRVPIAALNQRNIRPYDEKVDVWAVGVLAYELVVGKPPFEVEDEAKTASLIMYSHSIKFPTAYSPLWADFVRTVLVKDPRQRPSAGQLMQHAWITHHVQSAILKAAAQGRVSSKQQLLSPFPLVPATEWANTCSVIPPLPAGAAAVVSTSIASSTPQKPAVTQVVATASCGMLPSKPSMTAGVSTGVAIVSPVAAPAPKQPAGLPPRTPQQHTHGNYTNQAAACYTQPQLHMTFTRNEVGTPFASPTTHTTRVKSASGVSGPLDAMAVQAVQASTHTQAQPQDSPTLAFAAQLERARSNLLPTPQNVDGGGFNPSSYSSAASTFESVAAALESAAGSHNGAQSNSVRQSLPQPLFTRTSALNKTSSGSMTTAKEVPVDSTLCTANSSQTASSGTQNGTARSVHARAHGCVLVTHNSSTSNSIGGPQPPHALLRSIDFSSSNSKPPKHGIDTTRQDMESSHSKPEPVYSPARPTSVGVRPHTGLRKLQLGDGNGQLPASPSSPSMQGIDMALPSPALPAGSKQRSLAHLKHQAWA